MTDWREAVASDIRRINEACRPAVEAFQRDVQRIFAVMGEFAKTPQGKALLALAELKKTDPERFDRIMTAHHAEMRRPMCDCLCGRWNHHGICAVDATTSRRMVSEVTGPIDVSMCQPCSDAITAYGQGRPELARGQA